MKQVNNQPKSQTWHYQPPAPIPVSPILAWPPRPIALLKWISRYWLALSSVIMEFFLAWAIFAFFQPDSETMKTFGYGWAAQIWLRNMLLLIIIAGGLHLWFYGFAIQGKALKFDGRDLSRKGRSYSFNNQVKDNMFWSLVSGVTIWSLFEIFYFWAASNTYAPGLEFRQNPLWFALLFVLIPIWASLHFYWIHRFLHWPPLYKYVHSLHHRNINIGPWSGLSMHPIEHLLYFSSVLVHFLIPTHPVHFLFHLYNLGINPAFSHAGFEGLVAGGRKQIDAGDFFHQLHHRYFECNYGTAEMPWDIVFATFHNGTDEATKSVRDRQKRMHKSDLSA